MNTLELEKWYEDNTDIWIKEREDNPFGGYLDWTVGPKVRSIFTYPDDILREMSGVHKSNELLNEELRRNRTIYGGIGLSAIQIGVPWRVFVVKDRVFVNPKIIKKTVEIISKHEGCLSVPNRDFLIIRSEKIILRYQNENLLEYVEEEFDGLMSRVIQHEMDHLDGKLIIDHTT